MKLSTLVLSAFALSTANAQQRGGRGLSQRATRGAASNRRLMMGESGKMGKGKGSCEEALPKALEEIEEACEEATLASQQACNAQATPAANINTAIANIQTQATAIGTDSNVTPQPDLAGIEDSCEMIEENGELLASNLSDLLAAEQDACDAADDFTQATDAFTTLAGDVPGTLGCTFEGTPTTPTLPTECGTAPPACTPLTGAAAGLLVGTCP